VVPAVNVNTPTPGLLTDPPGPLITVSIHNTGVDVAAGVGVGVIVGVIVGTGVGVGAGVGAVVGTDIGVMVGGIGFIVRLTGIV
jgi:hypothetical protein